MSVIEDGSVRPWRFDPDAAPHFWVEADFLLWHIKSGPLGVPLVTTGNANDANPGALGQPGTRVLFGNSDLNYGLSSGGQFNLGGWFDEEARFGMEGGFFLLSQQNRDFRAFSNSSGSPILSVPIFNAQKQQEDQLPVSVPGVLAGGVVVTTSSSLGGADVNGSLNLVRSRGFQLDLLAGFRFLDLREDLNLQTPDVSISSVGSTIAGTSYNTIDDFQTSNQFYGGQLGARMGYTWERLSVDLTGKVALGSTYQTLNIDGTSVATGASGGSPQYSPGGIFAQPTNMGHYWAWDFTVVPEAELKVSFQVWHNLRFIAGYDFLYWSSVVRPGAQINRDVNISQSALLGTGVLSGPAQPVAPLTRTDFFTQGLTLGFDLRW
jgi:Putative beta barrel porin-7 (BBP7)